MSKRVARVRGINMAYDDAGRGAPVVLLHGFPFNHSMWREQAKALVMLATSPEGAAGRSRGVAR
jgi:pimeloyl-ACP methyl ester carboxylesterase